MKRKNFMFKFALTCMAITIFPISILLVSIITPILYSKGELDLIGVFATIGFWALFNVVSFIAVSLIGLLVFRIENPKQLVDDGIFIDTKDFVKIKKANINYIKARRFVFLYAIDVMAKPWKLISSLTIYFHDKDEMITFIKENEFLIEYIREKDLSKLGLK